jgi:uncharacterized membrane protein SpoIIM required for sporulation
VTVALRDLQLKSHRFRIEREGDWRKLEALLKRAEGGSIRRLNADEIISLTVLYRAALSSLSVARATSLDQSLVEYLDSLCTRAYFYVYGTRTTFLARIGQFFRYDWPLAVQGMWREIIASFAFTTLGAAVAYFLVMKDPDWFYAFISAEAAQGRGPGATTKDLRDILYDHSGKNGLSIFSTGLFTHNAGVALFSFALGIAFCLPTAFLLLYNGCSLGAMLSLYGGRGLGMEIGGWLIIHGVTEMSAFILAGAAGFKVGWALAFPGVLTRAEAVGHAGRQAAIVMCGVVLMLFIAGLLEGFARQLVTVDWIRYAVGITTGVLWGAYLLFPRSGGAARG